MTSPVLPCRGHQREIPPLYLAWLGPAQFKMCERVLLGTRQCPKLAAGTRNGCVALRRGFTDAAPKMCLAGED